MIANHSGFAGVDAVVLAHLIRQQVGRDVRVLAHPLYFDFSRTVRSVSMSFGLAQASVEAGVRCLKAGKVLVIFPEGERGNFKSSLRRYRLQPFRTGFIRIALATGAAVVPCVVTGAEESHLNLGSLNLGWVFPRARLPLPLNVLPLPAKWRIRFLRPVRFRAPARARKRGRPSSPESWLDRRARGARLRLQASLDRELRRREYVFFQRGPAR